ncbi:protein-disulfide reductase DsbD domain-containing protein [Nioella nitratireducens]|uniref:protein-disulfide reductase DsbD domain-containing protein n=1 Tax=Nioella nitratireducens TaxID=1287720 RepID=UPI000A066132|nr:protein-disulfide reductase DsbD domain-containing protein [Nioella nitratireducens]
MMKRTLFPALVALGLMAATAAQADAPLSDSDIVQVELLQGWRRDDGSHMAGLAIHLAPGWKTYWRAPGEAGIPPHLSLRDRAGLEGVDIHWPVPEVFESNGMRSIGYRQDVVFPLELTLTEGTGPIRLSGQLEIGVCHDICMPVTLRLRGTLPAGGHPDPRIAAALADRPLTRAEAGAGSIACTLTPISDGLRIEATIPIARQGGAEVVVFELPDPGTWISEAETARHGNTLTATADIVPPDAGPFALDRSTLRITVLGDGRAVEMTGCHG